MHLSGFLPDDPAKQNKAISPTNSILTKNFQSYLTLYDLHC